MWSRVVEVMLGCWLVISPFIFDHPQGEVGWWLNDMLAGLGAIVFGLASYWRPTGRSHLLTFLVGVWLIGFAYAQSPAPAAPAQQNEAVLGLLLLMFAVIPNHAAHPTPSWEEHRQSSICD